jgi:hypothetical protein
MECPKNVYFQLGQRLGKLTDEHGTFEQYQLYPVVIYLSMTIFHENKHEDGRRGQVGSPPEYAWDSLLH